MLSTFKEAGWAKNSKFLMKYFAKDVTRCLVIVVLLLMYTGCGGEAETAQQHPAPPSRPETFAPPPSPSPTASAVPNVQSEFVNDKNVTSSSPLAKFDFKDYSYPLPRGWQNPDNSDITLKNGRVQQRNFNDYRVLRINETPVIEVHLVKNGEAPGGIGEPGTIGIAPAVANAIFAATGKRIRKLPIKEQLRPA